MSQSWTLTIPLVPPSLNRYIRFHWRERSDLQAEWDTAVWALVKEAHVPLLERAHVSATVVFKVHRRRDPDNLLVLFKLLLDALVKAGVLPDDSLSHVTIEPVAVEIDRHYPHTRITVEPCPSPARDFIPV